MEKCYNFDVEVTRTVSGYIFAENELEACKRIKNQNWDESCEKGEPIIKIKTISEDK